MEWCLLVSKEKSPNSILRGIVGIGKVYAMKSIQSISGMLMSYGYELLCISPCLHFIDFRVPVPACSLTSVAEGLNRSR